MMGGPLSKELWAACRSYGALADSQQENKELSLTSREMNPINQLNEFVRS